MLRVVDAATRRLENGGDVPPEVFQKATDFLRGFADRCHHAKEEGELFPALEQSGLPSEGGPVGVMLYEHEEGRGYIRRLVAAADRFAQGDTQAKGELIAAGRGYIQLLSTHILKEDTILFPMADSLLPPEEQDRLVQAFEEIERTRLGPGVHEQYHHMLDELEKQTASW